MPRSFSKKDERQYQHIKDSYEDRGKSESKAEEIAARTVNKERREKGRTKTKSKHSQGTGNPNTRLEDRSKDELYNLAKQKDIGGRSKMTKAELVSAVRNAS